MVLQVFYNCITVYKTVILQALTLGNIWAAVSWPDIPQLKVEPS